MIKFGINRKRAFLLQIKIVQYIDVHRVVEFIPQHRSGPDLKLNSVFRILIQAFSGNGSGFRRRKTTTHADPELWVNLGIQFCGRRETCCICGWGGGGRMPGGEEGRPRRPRTQSGPRPSSWRGGCRRAAARSPPRCPDQLGTNSHISFTALSRRIQIQAFKKLKIRFFFVHEKHSFYFILFKSKVRVPRYVFWMRFYCRFWIKINKWNHRTAWRIVS